MNSPSSTALHVTYGDSSYTLDLETLCTLLYAALGIPLQIHVDYRSIQRIPASLQWDLHHAQFEHGLFQEADTHALYGKVNISQQSTTSQDTRNQNGYIIMGPVFINQPNTKIVQLWCHTHAILPSQYHEAAALLEIIPTLQREQFNALRRTLQYICSGTLSQNTLDWLTHITDERGINLEDIISIEQESLAKRTRLTHHFHNSYLFEKRLYALIAQGNFEQLRKFFNTQNPTPSVVGRLADDPLRQAKNLFIGTVVKIGMCAAIPGGLDVETTYQLIDTYTQRCEQCTTITQVDTLNYLAIIDFCKRVHDYQVPQQCSTLTKDIITYIQLHIHEKISIRDIAQYVHRSESLIAKRFKQELHMTLTQYIAELKIKEAQSLLQNTDYTVGAIAQELGYRTQSHFQAAFKAQVGVSPHQWRVVHA